MRGTLEIGAVTGSVRWLRYFWFCTRSATLGLVMISGPSQAQVIEIDESGVVTTYDKPTLFTTDGAQTIRYSSVDLTAVGEAVPVIQLIAEAAERNAVSADLIIEVARRESGFRQTAVSNRDAVGVMQLTAGTARELGVDRYDVRQNIHGGAAYLHRMLSRYNGNVRFALAAYNAGPGAVDRYHGVPPFPETTAYVAAILARLSQRALSGLPAPFTGQ